MEGANLGGSLPVPSVQELVKKEPHMKQVPARYIQDDDDDIAVPTIIVDSSSLLDQIPVIDLHALLFSSDHDMFQSELHKLDDACKSWGFFHLINHGVSTSLVNKMKSEIEQIFNIPIEEKMKLEQEPGDLEGFGQAFVVSDQQKLDWSDMFYLVTLPLHLRKPRLWQNLPLSFRETLKEYSLELHKLSMKILNLMAKALNIDEDEMSDLFEEGMQSMRMNYYPPCPQPELVVGLTPHSDGSGLTILLQVSEVDGLQIQHNGSWIPIKPIRDAFIVNIGDVLEIFSNGIYKSIEHRAVVHSEVERMSIAGFLSPRLDGELGPAKSLTCHGIGMPPQFRTLSVKDFFKGFFERKLDKKSYLQRLRIN
ncbi:protein SRG1-like [Impatiens glandulifera]|uniref:protein SRG1-like n=1 Tax=Impatiens glandulifera TaxID=253017 RepID=UPI001FB056F8|nr:protein SRG1-like [Impatiens glandulifera]